MKKNYSVEELSEGIKNKDNYIFRYIYEKYFSDVYNFVITNSGSETDAKDVFQETVIIIYKNILENKFTISGDFGSYLFSIGKKVHLKRLELKRKNSEIRLDVDIFYSVDEDKTSINALKSNLLYRHFKKLGQKCQQILKMFAKKVRMEEIAVKLGFSTTNAAKKQKHICQKELIHSIKNDKEYQDILDD